MSALPQYITTGGMQVFQQPYVLNSAVMQTFLLRADYEALVRTVNQSLNIPINQKYEYRPLMPYVQLNVIQIGHMNSETPPDSDMGWQTEVDISFTIWVGAGPLSGDFFKVDHVGVFYPYCFVDSPSAISSGREVYGFFKELGYFEMETWDRGGKLTVDADVLNPFSPNTKMAKMPVVSVTPPPANTPPPLGADADDMWTIMKRMIGVMLGDGDGVANLPTASVMEQFGYDLMTHNTSLVLLKQFRDVEVLGAACYQAIVEANMKTSHVRDLKMLSTGYVIDVADYDSHPICSDLGILPTQSPAAAMSFAFDFRIDVGHVVAGGSS